jgi:hypothetical protein
MHLLPAALLLPAGAAALCTRDGLKSTADGFFSLAIKNNGRSAPATPLDKLARGVKITQNNQLLSSPAASAFGNITAFASPFRVQSIDEPACTIATLAVAHERAASAGGPTAPAIVSLRLKMDSDGKELTEIELLNALAGSHALFRPLEFPPAAPALWSAPLPPLMPLPRSEFLRIVDSYPAGMALGDSSKVRARDDCPRFENGYKTTDHCGQNMDLFKWPVTDRRYVLDETTGVAMASFFFHYKLGKGKMMEQGIRPANGTTGLWLHEYFKVEGGQIVNVQAAMQTLPAEYKDVWGSS